MQALNVAAVCFDFFNTLAGLRDVRGRGRQLMDYFAALETTPSTAAGSISKATS